jgi:hypothetical protein
LISVCAGLCEPGGVFLISVDWATADAGASIPAKQTTARQDPKHSLPGAAIPKAPLAAVATARP